MVERFSSRHGYAGAEPEIVVREDAPEHLRYAVAQVAIDCGLSPSDVREVVSTVLYVAPDRGNWSEYPNIWDEATGHLERCPWPKVYDIDEEIHARLARRGRDEQYRDTLDKLFRETGIGWSFTEDGIMFRGGVGFAAATSEASQVLQSSGRERAATEIREAIRDISQRPEPDITGALQHAMAAVECTARDILGQPNATLGAMLPHLNLPKPLDTAIEKLWGYASDKARHVREGNSINSVHAELLVDVACAVCTFLVKSAAAPPPPTLPWQR